MHDVPNQPGDVSFVLDELLAQSADGTSEIGNIALIDRGYERIDARLRDLGARIERVSVERVPA